MKTGSCHCGAVKFNVEGEPSKAIECNCSHCSRKGFLLWFVPRSDFALATGEDVLQTYTFNKHAIQHRFCTQCGTQPFAYGRNPKDGSEMVAVNIRCLDGVDLDAVERVPVNGREF